MFPSNFSYRIKINMALKIVYGCVYCLWHLMTVFILRCAMYATTCSMFVLSDVVRHLIQSRVLWTSLHCVLMVSGRLTVVLDAIVANCFIYSFLFIPTGWCYSVEYWLCLDLYSAVNNCYVRKMHSTALDFMHGNVQLLLIWAFQANESLTSTRRTDGMGNILLCCQI